MTSSLSLPSSSTFNLAAWPFFSCLWILNLLFCTYVTDVAVVHLIPITVIGLVDIGLSQSFIFTWSSQGPLFPYSHQLWFTTIYLTFDLCVTELAVFWPDDICLVPVCLMKSDICICSDTIKMTESWLLYFQLFSWFSKITNNVTLYRLSLCFTVIAPVGEDYNICIAIIWLKLY